MTIPKGIIINWSGVYASIPTNFGLCDGTNETPDLRNYFVRGASGDSDITNTSSGSGTPVHSHPTVPSLDTGGSHNHLVTLTAGSSSGSVAARYDLNPQYVVAGYNHTHPVRTNFSTEVGLHAHTVSGSSPTNLNLPTYYRLYFIMKLNDL